MHGPIQSSSVTTSAVCSDATGSAVCSTSTTDKLHERVSAPYEPVTRRVMVAFDELAIAI
jgi:hypothetical protein